MTLTAITFPIMRFALCVMLLAMCFIASQCTADSPEQERSDVTDSGEEILSGTPDQPGTLSQPATAGLSGPTGPSGAAPGGTGPAASEASEASGADGADGAEADGGHKEQGGVLGGTGPSSAGTGSQRTISNSGTGGTGTGGAGTGGVGSGSVGSSGQGSSGGGGNNGQGEINDVPATITAPQAANQVGGGGTERGSPLLTSDRALEPPAGLEKPVTVQTTTTSIAPVSLPTPDAGPPQQHQQHVSSPSTAEGKETSPVQTDVVQQPKVDPKTAKTTIAPVISPPPPVKPQNPTLTTQDTATVSALTPKPNPTTGDNTHAKTTIPQTTTTVTPGKVTAPVNIQRTPTTTTAPAGNVASQTSTATEDKEPKQMQKSVSSTFEPLKEKSIPLENISANLTKGLPSLDNKDSSIGSSSLLALAALATLLVMAVSPAY